MVSFLRMVWKLFILASVFGIGYIVGREHSFEEDEEWDEEFEENTPENETPEPVASDGDGEKKSVTFTFEDGSATSVAVVGEFNDWDKDKHPLTKEGDLWKLDLELAKGRHEYKFVVNNTDWVVDPKCDESVEDKYGGRSSIVEVK